MRFINSKSNVAMVLPSMLNSFIYCPRRTYIDLRVGVNRSRLQRIRMFLGKMLHLVFRLFKNGYEKEKLIRAHVYGLDLIIVGKPDAYRVDEDWVILEELKSGRAPYKYMHGLRVWKTDLIQVLAYAYILSRNFNKPVKIVVRYRNHVEEFYYDYAYENLLFDSLIKYRKVLDGWIPKPINVPSKCNKCVYRSACLDF